MDHAVGLGGAAAKAREIFEGAMMYFGTGVGEALRALDRASQADDLMTCLQELRHDPRADEAGGTGEKDAHEKASIVVRDRVMG